MNVYDVRLVDDWPECGMNWPPDLPDVYTFLRVGEPLIESFTCAYDFQA
jgi:carboxypeptidase D